MSYEDPTDPTNEFPIGENQPEQERPTIEDLKQDLEVVFEDEEAIVDLLKNPYGFRRRGSVEEMHLNITNIFHIEKDGVNYTPLSGEDPKLVLEATINTEEGGVWDLKLYRIVNSLAEPRCEYVLKQIP